jgi:glucose-1-phosphate adenylyltransferase
MDLLRPGSGLSPEACGIRTNQSADQLPYDRPPVRIIGSAHVANAAVSPGCVIQGSVENSILSPGVIIEKGAFVKDSIIMHDAKVGKGTRIERSIIDKEASIGEESVIGQGNPRVANARFPDHVYSGLTLIGKRASIPSHSRIGTNCIVHPDVREDDFPSRELADGGTQEK